MDVRDLTSTIQDSGRLKKEAGKDDDADPGRGGDELGGEAKAERKERKARGRGVVGVGAAAGLPPARLSSRGIPGFFNSHRWGCY